MLMGTLFEEKRDPGVDLRVYTKAMLVVVSCSRGSCVDSAGRSCPLGFPGDCLSTTVNLCGPSSGPNTGFVSATMAYSERRVVNAP